MAIETVSVLAGGRRWRGWEEVTVQYGATQVARTASLTIADVGGMFGGGAWPLLPGQDVELYAGSALLIRGFVETFSPTVGKDDHRAVVTIASKAKDAVEASADHPTGEFRNKRVADIARAIDQTGTSWTGSAGDPIPLFRLRPGESVFEAAERAARAEGVMLIGLESGAVEVVRGIRGRHAGAIREGSTSGYEAGTARLSIEGRHSRFKIRGQAPETFGDRGQLPEVTGTVPLPRPRPKIVLMEGEANAERLKARADWEARQEAGAATTATLVVPRWRDEGGRIWQPAYTVFVHAPMLKISGDMAIRSVTLSQTGGSSGGTTATLELTDPRALGGPRGVGATSDPAWSVAEPGIAEKTLP